MTIKLGVFGEERVVKRVQKQAKQFPVLDVLPFTYTSYTEAGDQVKYAFMCDAMLFTDRCSYHQAIKKRKKQFMMYIEYNDYSMLSTIFQLGKHHHVKRLSIDSPQELKIDDYCQDMHLTDYTLYTIHHNNLDDSDKNRLNDFHKKLYQEKKTDAILTSQKGLYDTLKKEEFPVYFIQISNKCIQRALQKVIQAFEINVHSNNQIITGILSFKEKTSCSDNIQEEIKKRLSTFCQRNDAALIPNKANCFTMIGTDKLIASLKASYRDFPLLQQLETIAERPVHLAFGLGMNSRSSLQHAYIAQQLCQEEDSSISYLINERQEKIGPIGRRKNIDTNKLFHALIHRAHLNNELSYHFIDFIISRNNEPFSSNDIASHYNVTKRSAERTINKLLSGDIIKVFGEERPYQKGRPRKLFTLID